MKNANSIFTRTNRVVIRQFDLQDIEAFYQYRANPSIATYQSWENYTYEEAESFVQHQKNLINRGHGFNTLLPYLNPIN